jgi:hypothetical protein
MNCIEARDALLTAEPRELKGMGESALASHLRECAACAARADYLAGGLDTLGAQVLRSNAHRVRRAAFIATLPIAAALAAFAVLRAREPATVANTVHPADIVSVHVAPGQQAAVFKTKDPKVTVVWLSSGGGAP